jgi:rod shape-determining protein MreD
MKHFIKIILLTFVIAIIQFYLEKTSFNFVFYFELFPFIIFFEHFHHKDYNLLLIESFLIGLLIDALSITPLGLSSLSYLIMSFYIIKITDNFVFKKNIDRFFLIVSALFLKSLTELFLLKFFEFETLLSITSLLFLKPLIMGIILTILLFFALPYERESNV